MRAEPILFYTPGTCALACMIALEWSARPYSVCRVTKEERSDARYRQINPRGQVPALRIGERVLVEVNAILAHVADGNPGARLMPGPGTWERDIANQWFSWLASELHPAFWPFFSPSRYTTDPAGEESVKAAAVLMIRRQLGAADVHLASHEYILGGEISALDGYLFSIARWGTEMLDLPRDVPNVFRHYKQVAANPIVRRCTAVERGRELPSPSASLVARLELSTLDG